MRWLLHLVLLAILAIGFDVASAQETATDAELNQSLVSARIQTLRDAGSQEGSETTLDAYEQVLNWLGEAEVHAASEKTYVQALNDAPLEEAGIRDRMESTDYRVADLDPAEVSKLKKQDLEEKLTALRTKLRDVSTDKGTLDDRIASEQSSAPKIQARFEEIDQRIQELANTAVTIDPSLQPSQFEASQWAVLAERKALMAERRSLEARLASQPVRYSRRKAESDELALILDGLTFEIGVLEKELASREEVLEAESSTSLDENAPGYGFVKTLSESNAQHRAEREKLDSSLQALKDEADRIAQKYQSLNDRFKAVKQVVSQAENSSSLGHVLMVHWHQTDSFQLPENENPIAGEIGDHVIRRTQYEDSLGTLANTADYVSSGFAKETGSQHAEMDENIIDAAKSRIRTKRELLTALIASETELINTHGNMERTRSQLAAEFEEYERFLRSRILWVPSHPPISISLLENIEQEFQDLVHHLSTLTFGSINPGKFLLLALVIVSLLLRRKMNSYLKSINKKVGRVREDSIRYTFQALLITIVQSLSFPLTLVILAKSLESTSTGTAPYLESGMMASALILFLIILLGTACKENGIARVHFQWEPATCNETRRFTNGLLLWWWPLLVTTAFLLKVEVDSINAVFGRLLFCVSMVLFGFLLSRFLAADFREPFRTRNLRFSEATLVLLASILFVAGSLLGYIYSVSVIWDALLKSLVIGSGLLFFYYFMQRWLLVVRRRLRYNELLASRQALKDGEDSTVEPEMIDLVSLSESVAHLLKAGTLLAGAIWFAFIWTPFFRALEALQRVTLWTVSDMSEGEAILTSITLASLVMALFIGFITILAARYLPQLVALVLRSRKGISAGSRYAIVKLLGYLIVGAGLLTFLSTLGLRWDRLQWLVAALGVGIGFGLQEIIANFISGLIILFERPIRVGDIITVGDNSGQVRRIQIRATTIRDFDGKELLVPNKEFVTGRLLNWTLSNTDIRMSLEVGIAYGSDVRKAITILEDLLANHEMILDDPEPDVLFREFGDSSLVLTARYFFSDVDQRGFLLSDLHKQIYDAFDEAGIVIAFPQIDVHLDRDLPSPATGEALVPGTA